MNEKVAIIGHGSSALLALAREFGFRDCGDLMRVQPCNLSPEQIAERDRPVSRQERRAAERRASKAQQKEADS